MADECRQDSKQTRSKDPNAPLKRTNPSCLLFIAGWSFLRRIRGRVNRTEVGFSKGAYLGTLARNGRKVICTKTTTSCSSSGVNSKFIAWSGITNPCTPRWVFHYLRLNPPKDWFSPQHRGIGPLGVAGAKCAGCSWRSQGYPTPETSLVGSEWWCFVRFSAIPNFVFHIFGHSLSSQ